MKQEIDAHYPLYINGEWVEGEGGRMDVACPANGEKLCAVSAASSGDVDRAVRAARAAFPAWRSLPLPRRYDALMEIHGRIVRNCTDFVSRNLWKPDGLCRFPRTC